MRPICTQCLKANRGTDCQYHEKKHISRTQLLQQKVSKLEARLRELESEQPEPSGSSSSSSLSSPSPPSPSQLDTISLSGKSQLCGHTTVCSDQRWQCSLEARVRVQIL